MVEVTLVAMRSVTVVPAKLAAPEIFKLVEVTPPTTCKPPCTAKVSIGEDELMPTLPLVRTVSKEPAAAVEVTIENGLAVPSPCMVSFAAGVVVPMPTDVPKRPVPLMLKWPVCWVPAVAPCKLTKPMVVVVTHTGAPLPADCRI